jgi:type II secretory ATPase GspE/PulE/Tfp pilus assembly ATPase PilB-like protein
MGVEPFLIASAMKMVISQRLGKRVCSHCKEEYTPKEKDFEKAKEILKPILDEESLNNLQFYHGK